MNSRIYTDRREPLIKIDMVVKKPFLNYKIGDIVQVSDYTIGLFTYTYKHDCLNDIKELFYTQAEWRDIQIDEIFKD